MNKAEEFRRANIKTRIVDGHGRTLTRMSFAGVHNDRVFLLSLNDRDRVHVGASFDTVRCFETPVERPREHSQVTRRPLACWFANARQFDDRLRAPEEKKSEGLRWNAV